MFERNRVERPSEMDRASSSVEVTLEDGETVLGRVYYPATRSLGEELNGAGTFVDFEVHDGDRFFLTKKSIQIVRQKQIPRADQLARAQSKSELFNPWRVLGVPENAPKEQVREAYHRLVKRYHPDRFANSDLPGEVVEYLNAMARRINTAYTTLVGNQKAAVTPRAEAGAPA